MQWVRFLFQKKHIKYFLLILSAGIFLAICIEIISQILADLPAQPGYDWKNFHHLLNDPDLDFSKYLISNPPWIIFYLKPLGWLPFLKSWTVLLFLTLGVMIISLSQLERKIPRILGGFLLLISFISIRQLMDGNLAVFMISGILLILYGINKKAPFILGAGLFLSTAKYQESWILLIVVVIYVLRQWKRKDWVKVFAPPGIAALPGIFIYGPAWFSNMFLEQTRASGYLFRPFANTSLTSILTLENSSIWLYILLWMAILGITLLIVLRLKPVFDFKLISLLAAASLLLFPYSNELSLVTLLAVGIIPLLEQNVILSLLLYLLANMPYLLVFFGQTHHLPNQYWTAWLTIVWASFAILISLQHKTKSFFSNS